MVRKENWKTWVVLVVAVAIVASAGGLLMASNMGFKINKQFFANFSAPAGPKRDNWTSLPYNSPYNTARDLCNGLNFTNSAGTVKTAQFFVVNPVNGKKSFAVADMTPLGCNPCLPVNSGAGSCYAIGYTVTSCTGFTTTTCTGAGAIGGAAGQNPPVPSSAGILIRNTAAAPVPSSTPVVLVGSSNETKPIPVIFGGFLAAAAPKFDNWISVPYHTTWAKAQDVCVTLGLAAGQGQIIRSNADPAAGSAITTNLCSTTTNNFSLVMGEALLVRKVNSANAVGNCNIDATINGALSLDLCGVAPDGKLPPHF